MRHQQEFAATRNLVARSPRVLYGRRALGRPYLDLQALKAEEASVVARYALLLAPFRLVQW